MLIRESECMYEITIIGHVWIFCDKKTHHHLCEFSADLFFDGPENLYLDVFAVFVVGCRHFRVTPNFVFCSYVEHFSIYRFG